MVDEIAKYEISRASVMEAFLIGRETRVKSFRFLGKRWKTRWGMSIRWVSTAESVTGDVRVESLIRGVPLKVVWREVVS